jgi:hypothetical protein
VASGYGDRRPRRRHRRGARKACSRGAQTAAGAALERAAALSADSRQRSARLVCAAEIAYELGLADAVRRLLDHTATLELDRLDAARAEWLHQMVTGNVWYESGAAQTFVRLAREMNACGEGDLALQSLVPIAHRSWWTQTRTRTRQYLVDTARGTEIPDDDPRVLVVIARADPETTGTLVRSRIAHIPEHAVTAPIAAMDVGIAAEKACDFAAGADSWRKPWRVSAGGQAGSAHSGAGPPRMGNSAHRRV